MLSRKKKWMMKGGVLVGTMALASLALFSGCFVGRFEDQEDDPSGKLLLCVLNQGGPLDPCVMPPKLDFSGAAPKSKELQLFRVENDTGSEVRFHTVLSTDADFSVETVLYNADPADPKKLIRVPQTLPALLPTSTSLYIEVSMIGDIPGGEVIVSSELRGIKLPDVVVPIVDRVGNCEPGTFDVDGDSSNGCEYLCTKTSLSDEPDDAWSDSNCDGIDGNAAKAIFVAPSGNDGNAGTMNSPKATIGGGIGAAKASGKTQVYISEGNYHERVTLESGISLYGGYSQVKKWARSSSYVAQIESDNASDGFVAGIVGNDIQAPTTVDLLHIKTLDTILPGTSNYGVYCNNCAQLSLKNNTVEAGTAGPGAAGIQGSNGGNGNPGSNGSAPATCTSTAFIPGGAGGTSACGMNGGTGGNGGAKKLAGGAGAAGAGGTPGGDGGAAGKTGSTNGKPGGAGANGSGGSNGGPGAGGNGGAVIEGKWSGHGGATGSNGIHGNGGGGGGGGGGQNCSADPGCSNSPGNGGGGGGGGGCGGAGGGGGSAGGGSFGVFLVKSTGAILTSNTISSANGGQGGSGAPGGAGGKGSSGGIGALSCVASGSGPGGDGGDGANGGGGGPGGGGAGGPSYAIFLFETMVSTSGNNLSHGMGGPGGTSSGNNAGAPGASGDLN